MRVLVVDDLFFVREEITDILERYGHTVVAEAEDGLEAIELFRELKPDAVSIDVNMPKMNGLEAAKIMKSENKDVRILLCSSMVYYDKIKDQGKSIGIEAFVEKPFSTNTYMEEFEKLL
jgi:two-component system chemotaxis response regulator CheY